MGINRIAISLLRNPQRQAICSISRRYHEGQSTVTILNQNQSCLMISSYNNLGFRLNNGLFVFGSMIIFPHSVIAWTVANKKNITEDSLSLFCHMVPKIDILILGTEDSYISKQLYTNVANLMQLHNINFELLPTCKACTTFNYVNEENRFAAGAFIPTMNIPWTF